MKLFGRWKLILCMLLVFASGAVVGGGIMLQGVKKYVERRLDSTQWASHTQDWLRRELEMSDDQMETVHPAIEQAIEELVALRENAEAERSGIFGRMLLEISDELNERQREQLQALIHKHAESRAVDGKR